MDNVMAATNSNMRLLDRFTIAEGIDLASELFHRLNRIIPEN